MHSAGWGGLQLLWTRAPCPLQTTLPCCGWVCLQLVKGDRTWEVVSFHYNCNKYQTRTKFSQHVDVVQGVAIIMSRLTTRSHMNSLRHIIMWTSKAQPSTSCLANQTILDNSYSKRILYCILILSRTGISYKNKNNFWRLESFSLYLNVEQNIRIHGH